MVCFNIKEILETTNGRLLGKCNSDMDCTTLNGIATDSRTISGEDIFIALRGQNFDGHKFINTAVKKGVKCVIISDFKKIAIFPKNIFFIVVKDTTRAMGELAKQYRSRFNIAAVGITGSNGKTTTKALIACILEKKFPVLANIGTENNIFGLSKTLFGLSRTQKVIIAELGTNHKGEIEVLAEILQPNIAVITNIASAHIGNFNSKDRIFREKISLLRNLSGDSAVSFLNGDDKYLRKVKQKEVHFYGIKKSNEIIAKDIEFNLNGSSFKVKDKNSYVLFKTRLLGLHNIYNTLAAIAVARFFKIDYTTIKKAIKTFKPPYGRLNIRKINGVTFFDDTYNANPDSLASGLETVNTVSTKKAAKKILILGDMLELGKFTKKCHEDAARLAKKHGFNYLLTFGEHSILATKQLRKNKDSSIFCRHFKKHSEIANFIHNILKKDDFVFIKGSRRMKMEEIIKCFTNFSTN